jgi:hypothetical protein
MFLVGVPMPLILCGIGFSRIGTGGEAVRMTVTVQLIL